MCKTGSGDEKKWLYDCAVKVYLSTRRGSWIINRVGLNGHPVDIVLSTTVVATLARCFPSLVDWLLEQDMNKRFDHELYRLKPNHHPRRKFLMKIFFSRLLFVQNNMQPLMMIYPIELSVVQ